MRKPGLPPTALQEYHADGTGSGEAAALASVVTACQDLAVARGTVNIPDTLSCRRKCSPYGERWPNWV